MPDPSYFRSTANERTHLAWNRTALAWLAIGAVLVRYHGQDGLGSRGAFAGYALCIGGIGLWMVGLVRYHQRGRAILAGSAMPGSVPLIRTVTCVVAAVITVVILLEAARLVEL